MKTGTAVFIAACIVMMVIKYVLIQRRMSALKLSFGEAHRASESTVLACLMLLIAVLAGEQYIFPAHPFDFDLARLIVVGLILTFDHTILGKLRLTWLGIVVDLAAILCTFFKQDYYSALCLAAIVCLVFLRKPGKPQAKPAAAPTDAAKAK